MRPLPLVLPETEAFWTGGREGRLWIKRCPACGRLWHPSHTVCASCPHRELEPAEVSGAATVVACTVNVQQWLPEVAPPYVLAIVALDEDPRVRLTTNVVDIDPYDVQIGLRVQVRFEQHDDVWLPLFAPSPDGDGDAAAPLPEVPLPEVVVRPMVRHEKFEDRVAITGIGMSAIGRRLMRAPLTLTMDACLAAIEDAGLAVSDIDGLATWPGVPDLQAYVASADRDSSIAPRDVGATFGGCRARRLAYGRCDAQPVHE